MRVIGDELSLLPPAFIHAISNLDKNPSLKVIGLGNPKDTMDALGMLAEPAPHLGGWDGGIDQTPGTKTWETRRKGGICIQLPGDDSPNLDGKLGCPLITQEAIDRDISFYGTDSVWFSMMDMGRMPRGQGSAPRAHPADVPEIPRAGRTQLAGRKPHPHRVSGRRLRRDRRRPLHFRRTAIRTGGRTARRQLRARFHRQPGHPERAHAATSSP